MKHRSKPFKKDLLMSGIEVYNIITISDVAVSVAGADSYLDSSDAADTGFMVLDDTTAVEWMDAASSMEIDISELLEPYNCPDYHYITVKNNELVCLELPKEDQMYDLKFLLIVILIVIFTVKFIMPKLTLRTIFRAFIRLVKKPFEKAQGNAKQEWEKAKLDESLE